MPGVVTTNANLFISRWPIKPGKRDEFLAIFNPLWQGSMDFMNENCNLVFYGFGRDPNEMIAIESYKDESAVAAIRQSPQFKEFVSKMLDLCSGPMTMELFNGFDIGREIFDQHPAGKSDVHPDTGKNHAVFL